VLEEMVLDTIVPLKAAISLYKKHGFEECEAYYHNPMDDVIYMRKAL
jgi:ribosomal protein S18 acetylase RimI-like enzyme